MKPAKPMDPATRELFEKARTARENAYSPYSRHKVGAALRASDGRVYTGCNVENSSYGGTICAERTAIVKAVSEIGPSARIVEVVVVTDATPAWPPCGFCRQVLSEFAGPDIPVRAVNLAGDAVTTRFGDLLPQAFTPEHLGK